MNYEYYEKCDCGGDYTNTTDWVMLSCPRQAYVKCLICKKTSTAHLLEDCSDWVKPEWQKE